MEDKKYNPKFDSRDTLITKKKIDAIASAREITEEDIQEEMAAIVTEYGGFGQIPLNHEYWSLQATLQQMQSVPTPVEPIEPPVVEPTVPQAPYDKVSIDEFPGQLPAEKPPVKPEHPIAEHKPIITKPENPIVEPPKPEHKPEHKSDHKPELKK